MKHFWTNILLPSKEVKELFSRSKLHAKKCSEVKKKTLWFQQANLRHVCGTRLFRETWQIFWFLQSISLKLEKNQVWHLLEKTLIQLIVRNFYNLLFMDRRSKFNVCIVHCLYKNYRLGTKNINKLKIVAEKIDLTYRFGTACIFHVNNTITMHECTFNFRELSRGDLHVDKQEKIQEWKKWKRIRMTKWFVSCCELKAQ